MAEQPKSASTAPKSATSADAGKSTSDPKKPEFRDLDEENDKEGKSKEDDGPALVGNGGTTDKYIWTQTAKALEVTIPAPAGVQLSKKTMIIEMEPTTLRIVFSKNPSEKAYLEGSWCEMIDTENSTWIIDDYKKGKCILLMIAKFDKNSLGVRAQG